MIRFVCVMKLLTICIPTYKRPVTLRRCIDSVVSQIEKYDLVEDVGLCVVNDASPDDTVSVLDDYASLDFFDGVTREQNLGMNVNIKIMLSEVMRNSHYQLIITDDDYLQPDILGEIVKFLHSQQDGGHRAPAIWTPRYSYLEDGSLLCVECNPFYGNRVVKPSVVNAGRYMRNGFILSGLILQAEYIDYKFWEFYDENAYFPMVFFGDLVLKEGAYFWDKNIVHHTVLNDCNWERWGENDTIIKLRLFGDFVNAYVVMASRVSGYFKSAVFYCASFFSIYRRINGFLNSGLCKSGRRTLLDAVKELRMQGVLKFKSHLRFLMVLSLFLSVISTSIKTVVCFCFSLFSYGEQRKKRYRKASRALWEGLQSGLIVFEIILS